MAKPGTGDGPRQKRLSLKRALIALAAVAAALSGVWVIFYYYTDWTRAGFLFHWYRQYDRRLEEVGELPQTAQRDRILAGLGSAALEQTKHKVRYDSSYFEIPYPMGDVPPEIGVCADVVVRAYRTQGIDLQQLVHEDMERSFGAYPHIWFNTSTDTNIDHRRVQNLVIYFRRCGQILPVTNDPADYRPGDVVAWRMYNRRLHCGIVVDDVTPGSSRLNVVHNIGKGPKSEDRLFKWPIMGHFRYCGE